MTRDFFSCKDTKRVHCILLTKKIYLDYLTEHPGAGSSLKSTTTTTTVTKLGQQVDAAQTSTTEYTQDYGLKVHWVKLGLIYDFDWFVKA